VYFQTVEAAAGAARAAAATRSVGLVLHDFSGGGSERIAIRLANRWAELGWRVTLVCGSAKGPLAAMVGPGVAVLQPSPAIPRGLGARAALGRAAAEAFTLLPPDVVFVPGNYHWPIVQPLVAALGERAPPVVAQVSSPLTRIDRGPLRQALFDRRCRATLGRVAATVALCDAAAEDADRLAGRAISTVLPLPALADDTPPPVHAGAGILAAGRFEPQKAFDLALQAFAKLPPQAGRLTLLGDGPMRPKLEALARRLGVADRVSMPGFVPDIRPWLDQARVFLLSSRWEGYGAVVVEALAAGRPVVSTACNAAAAELIARSGRGGVTPQGDAAALAASLARELAAPPPDLAALAQVAQDFRIGPIAEAYLELFERVRLSPDATAAR